MAATNIACWNGTNWSAVGNGIEGGVLSLVLRDNHLYAGGAFTTAGGVSATNIARWDGSSWSPLGSGVANDSYPGVNALLLKDDSLYVGGTAFVLLRPLVHRSGKPGRVAYHLFHPFGEG